MKRILLITTGGTIASGPGASGLTPRLSGEDILAKVPELKGLATVSTFDLMSLDSTNLSPEHWLAMASCLAENYDSYDGFVISHGTDTLTWTAAALQIILDNLGKPVVLVASQLTLDEPGSDAPCNLAAALHMASLAIPGVFAACNGQIFPALWFSKIASENLDCFAPTNALPLAYYDYERENLLSENFLQWLNKPDIIPEEIPQGNLKVNTAWNENIANLLLTPLIKPEDIALYKNYDGIIVHGYGAGGIPSDESNDLLTALGEIAQTKPVICITQCMMNGVHLHRYEVGQKALRAGIISGGKLAAEGATVLLMVCLGKKMNLTEIRQVFEEYN